MTAWIFTFGHGQRLRSTNRVGRADFEWNGLEHVGDGFDLLGRYVRIEGEHDEARERMVAMFGPVWSMEYKDGPDTDDMIVQYGWIELSLTEPVGEPKRPYLGLATTRELLNEIRARGATEAYYPAGRDMAIGAERLLDELPASMLDYRTVDGDALPAEALP